MMNSFAIFYDDLKEDAQNRLLEMVKIDSPEKLFNGDSEDYKYIPLAMYNFESEYEEVGPSEEAMTGNEDTEETKETEDSEVVEESDTE